MLYLINKLINEVNLIHFIQLNWTGIYPSCSLSIKFILPFYEVYKLKESTFCLSAQMAAIYLCWSCHKIKNMDKIGAIVSFAYVNIITLCVVK